MDTYKLNEKIQQLKRQFEENQKIVTSRMLQKSPSGHNVLKMQTMKRANKRMVDSKKTPRPIKIEKYMPEQDDYFVKNILVPYLSSVYFGLIARQSKDYLSCQKTKLYLNLPELIGLRLVK